MNRFSPQTSLELRPAWAGWRLGPGRGPALGRWRSLRVRKSPSAVRQDRTRPATLLSVHQASPRLREGSGHREGVWVFRSGPQHFTASLSYWWLVYFPHCSRGPRGQGWGRRFTLTLSVPIGTPGTWMRPIRAGNNPRTHQYVDRGAMGSRPEGGKSAGGLCVLHPSSTLDAGRAGADAAPPALGPASPNLPSPTGAARDPTRTRGVPDIRGTIESRANPPAPGGNLGPPPPLPSPS